jgi:hypothetical protein
MSYIYKDKADLKMLRRIHEFKFINEYVVAPEEDAEVIEVGHWVKQLLE